MLISDPEQERLLLALRPLMLKERIPIFYETNAEYYARKMSPRYEPRLTLWRRLTQKELKLFNCI